MLEVTSRIEGTTTMGHEETTHLNRNPVSNNFGLYASYDQEIKDQSSKLISESQNFYVSFTGKEVNLPSVDSRSSSLKTLHNQEIENDLRVQDVPVLNDYTPSGSGRTTWSSNFIDKLSINPMTTYVPSSVGRLSELTDGTIGDINPSTLSRSNGCSIVKGRRKLSNAVGDNHHTDEDSWGTMTSKSLNHKNPANFLNEKETYDTLSSNHPNLMVSTGNMNTISPSWSSSPLSTSYPPQHYFNHYVPFSNKTFSIPESHPTSNEHYGRYAPLHVHASGYQINGLTSPSPSPGLFPISTIDGIFDMNNDSSDSSLANETDGTHRDGILSAQQGPDIQKSFSKDGFNIMGRIQSQSSKSMDMAHRLSTSDMTHDISSKWLERSQDFKMVNNMEQTHYSQLFDFFPEKNAMDHTFFMTRNFRPENSSFHEETVSTSAPISRYRAISEAPNMYYDNDIQFPQSNLTRTFHRYNSSMVLDNMDRIIRGVNDMYFHDSNDGRSKDLSSMGIGNSPVVTDEDYLKDLAALARESFDYAHRYVVEFKSSRRDLFVCPLRYRREIQLGSLVIVEADRGKDMGKIVEEFDHRDGIENAQEVKRIYRPAQSYEIQQLVSKTQDELKTLTVCQSKVRQKRLPMQVIDAEYQWDRRKLTFYFMAEHRIDFRELVRDLFKLYKTRIWMCSVDEARQQHHVRS